MCDTPRRPVGNPHYSHRPLRNRQLFAVIRRIKHWKQCLGAPMCYFGTNSPLLIYTLCVILPTGHWVTPHCSRRPLRNTSLPLTGHWGTAAFDCNMGHVKHSNMRHVKHIKPLKPSRGPRWVIFDHIILSRRLSYREDSQPATEEHLITPNWPLRNSSIWQQCGARETRKTLKTISEGLDV